MDAQAHTDGCKQCSGNCASANGRWNCSIQPAVKFILSKFLCQIKSGVEECVTNEDIIGVLVTNLFIQPSQDAFESLP